MISTSSRLWNKITCNLRPIWCLHENSFDPLLIIKSAPQKASSWSRVTFINSGDWVFAICCLRGWISHAGHVPFFLVPKTHLQLAVLLKTHLTTKVTLSYIKAFDHYAFQKPSLFTYLTTHHLFGSMVAFFVKSPISGDKVTRSPRSITTFLLWLKLDDVRITGWKLLGNPLLRKIVMLIWGLLPRSNYERRWWNFFRLSS